MIFLLVFWLFLLGALAIGWQAGDRDDRGMVVAIALAAIVTLMIRKTVPASAPILVGLVDLGLLIVTVRYALISRRHWPLWFAGFHSAGLIFGVGALLAPQGDPYVPMVISGFWSVAALLAMIVGLLLDRNAKVANR